jgi:hypothetical protein
MYDKKISKTVSERAKKKQGDRAEILKNRKNETEKKIVRITTINGQSWRQ